MKKRIITGLIALCVLIPILVFAYTPALPIGIAVCSVLAVFEMLGCTGFRKSVVVSVPFYLCAAVIPFLLRYLPAHVFKIAFSCVLITVLYLFTVLIFSHGKYPITDLCVAFTSLLYILIGFNGIEFLYSYTSGGKYVYLIVFLGAWMTDTFAYFCGMLFGRGGKHKLIPDVSPKKTVEGSIGGTVFCVLSLVLYGIIIQKVDPGFQANLPIIAVAGVAVAIVAQIGDLSMSVIKRHYGVKDYGWIFPGHGGILDRFDSVLAVSVVLTVFSIFLNFFEVL